MINKKVNEGNKARLNILQNQIFSSANIGKLSNVSVSFTLGETIGPNHVPYKCSELFF